MSIFRSGILLTAGVFLLSACEAEAPETQEVPTVANALEEKLDAAFKAGEFKNLHTVLVLKDGKIFAERHYTGMDETIFEKPAEITMTPDRLHDLRSVTKSITSLLYGIALNQGIVPGLDEPVVAAFPQYEDLAGDPNLHKILISHVLTMTMGQEWNENLPYSDPRNSEIAMEMAPDRYRFILEQEILSEPGTKWNYSGGATALIGHLIARGSGMSIDKYAEEKLFGPLGITDYKWIRGNGNEPMTASGLRLNPHDTAKIGTLVINHGIWEGEQIVPQDWLYQSFDSHIDLPFGGLRYGYFWWLSPEKAPVYWGAGFGNGGQRLWIDNGNRLVVVILAGNYNQPNDFVMPTRILQEFIYPAVLAAD